ncbi:MAG: hypothetical protein OXN92_04970 [Gammaproteobacteria bacterium]|nr:hypothetical protein [Gammaproteobacteria bacterium]
MFNEDERRDLIDFLVEHPLAGDEIPGTVRRGGARVIYFFGGEGVPIYALLAYSKSDKTDLNPSERRGGRARGRHQVSREAEEMSTFGEELIQSLN